MVEPAAAVSKPPALFGGHRGGGKKRADGLVAGSEAAKAADREKDRMRKSGQRAEKKIAPLPAALPSVANATANADAPLVPGELAVPGAVASAPTGEAGVLLPTFVAWSGRMLERPIRLLTKIIDRFRVGKLMERVRKLKLPKEIEAEAERRMVYKAEQLADFNAALTNCAVIEFNKRRMPGAEQSHWIELAMTSGELINCHLDTVDWLEKQILAKSEKEKAETELEKKV
jgi:hypothetical protein